MSSLLGRTAISAAFAGTIFAVAGIGVAVAQDKDPVVAIVNGDKIHMSDVNEARQFLPAQAQGYPFSVLFEHLVNNLVTTKLLAAEARRTGLHKDDKIKARIANIEEQILRQGVLEKQLADELTDEKLRGQYDTFVKDNKPADEVHARHILVETEEKAMDVISKLGKGEDFAKLAKAVSTGPSGKNGGDLGFFTRERMVPAFSQAAFELKAGQITKKPVKTQFGWHVIKVEERRESKAPAFDEMRGQLEETLRNTLVQAFIEKLTAGAKVERFDPEGKPRQK